MKGLDATQAEQLRQIAEYLAYQREQQDISLEKISTQTYIPLRLLKALDSLQLDQLPEPVYIRGFIRRYADALGLNRIEIADAFPVEPAVPVAPEAEGSVGSGLEAQSSSYEVAPSINRGNQPASSRRPWLLAGIGAAVLVGAIALVAQNFSKQPAVTPPETATSPAELPADTAAAPTQTSPSAPASPEAATSVPSPKATSPSPTTGSPSPVQADVNLTGRSWMQVIADGKTAYEGTLGQGEQRTWQAKKQLVITAGNAGAVVLSCNRGEAKPLGKAGQVVDATCSVSSARTGQSETRSQ
jgi:cytoskeletal protein RodZ